MSSEIKVEELPTCTACKTGGLKCVWSQLNSQKNPEIVLLYPHSF